MLGVVEADGAPALRVVPGIASFQKEAMPMSWFQVRRMPWMRSSALMRSRWASAMSSSWNW
ncbi:hypothetical protein P405_17530 [Streptomyces sp. FR-008]|nr:hypothetical protein P405_17530 [Streptomyces sp. FR-008]